MHEEKYQLNMMPQSSDHTLAVYAQEDKASHRNCNFQTRCYGNFKYDNNYNLRYNIRNNL